MDCKKNVMVSRVLFIFVLFIFIVFVCCFYNDAFFFSKSLLTFLNVYFPYAQCVEEILGYLKSCFSREPVIVTICVQQVS